MSVFTAREVTVEVYEPIDSNVTKISNYREVPDFTIKMHLIRRNEDTVVIMGQETGEYVANVKGGYTNATRVVRGVKVKIGDESYKVINRPRYNASFDVYKVLLNRFE